MSKISLLRKLATNAIRYRYLKITGSYFPLEAISLELTHRCICRCQMCNIWKIPNTVKDLPLSTWTELLSSPELSGLRELDMTGGEPFLRDDLQELVCWISNAKSKHFPNLKTVAITTNGILTDRVLKTTEEIIAPLKEQQIDLVLACGLDAVGDVHDQVRQFPGAWQKLETTIEGLEELRQSYANLVLGLKTTIVPANVNELNRIGEFANKHGMFTIISPCIITANRFGNEDLETELDFSPEEIEKIKEFYAGPVFAWSNHRLAMLRYLDSGRMEKPCSAGFNTVFVRHTGEVFPCPLIPTPLGNITETTLESLLKGPKASQFRKHIRSFPECEKCTEPGLERIAWPFEGYTCLKHIAKFGFDDFAMVKSHMGLDKYL